MPASEQNAALGHQKSMWNQEEIANFYAEFSQNYDQDIENDQSCYPSPFRIGTWAVEWLKNRRIHNHSTLSLNSHQKTREIVNILDLGCGTGQSGVMFVEHGRSDPSFQYTLTGVDTTPEMLEKARKRSYEHLHVLDLEQYPYNNQQFPESNYDALVCVGVMDFIKDPLQFLTYIRRFMKPHLKPQDSSGGGSSANEALPQSVIGLTLPERHPHSDLSSFSRSEMEELLRRCGFFVERHERILGYRDSKTNQVQYYHGWLCTLASPSSE